MVFFIPILRFLCCWLWHLFRRWQLSSAIGTPRGLERNRAQTIGAFTGGRGLCWPGFEAIHQCVHRPHDEEVDDKCEYQEADHRIDEVTYLNRASSIGNMNS